MITPCCGSFLHAPAAINRKPGVMKQILIRDMVELDIPQVAAIEKISFTAPWSETSFLNELHKPHSRSRVAVLNDAIAAYICYEQILDEGHILTLAVHPAYRNMSIASGLVRNMIEDLRKSGCKFLYLEVRVSNAAAKRLYEGLGFRIVGVRKGYYVSPGEDAVIMMAEL